jgi:hypothetical protein
MPPQPPPRKSSAKPLLIVLGVVAVIGLVVGGVFLFNLGNGPNSTAAGTSTTHAPTGTTTHSAPSSGSSSSGGAPSSSPKALANAFVAAVNSHNADAALPLVCAKDRDNYATTAQNANSIFNPANNAHMALNTVSQSDGTHASAKVHSEGTLGGKPQSQDGTINMVQQNGGWAICSS